MTVYVEQRPGAPLSAASPEGPAAKHEFLALLAVLLPATVFNAFFLFRFPPPFVDEVELVSRAWSYVRTGRNIADLGPVPVTSQTPAGEPVQLLGTWLYSIPVRFFGPNLWAVRMESLAFGVVLLLAVYFIGRRLYGPTVGCTAVALVAVSDGFVTSSHLARYDIITAAVGFGAIALVLWDDEVGIPIKSAVAGLLLGLTFEMHGNASLYGPAVVALLYASQGRRLLRSRRLYAFAGGVCVGLTFFAWVHIISVHILSSRAQTGLNGLSNLVLSADGIKRPPFSVLDPQVWFDSLVGSAVMIMSYTPWRGPVILAALLTLAIRRGKPDLQALALFAALFVEPVGILSYKAPYYEALFTPLTDVTIWTRAAKARTGSRWRAVAGLDAALVATAGLLFLSMGGLIPLMQQNAKADYDQVNARLRSVLPAGSTLVGDDTFWFGLTDHHFIFYFYLLPQAPGNSGRSLVDTYRYLGADYLITGSWVQRSLEDDPSKAPAWARANTIPRADWERFIGEYGELVTTIHTQAFGDTSVYRIRTR
ncbi:MAG: glycosyltransferase family 39 protein [Chloroflexi bacterium]|nr:glycosyltransferase family 39 protein [Chloroflexota bacterium]